MKRKPASKPEPVRRTKQSTQRGKRAMHRTKQNPAAITEREYSGFQHAYDVLNAELFHAKLPQLLVTLQRQGNTEGYFSPDRFQSRTGQNGTHELALNPNAFPGRKETGQRMGHYILEGGPFESACRKLQADGFVLNWESLGDKKGKKPPE